jgi:hypothetical protein
MLNGTGGVATGPPYSPRVRTPRMRGVGTSRQGGMLVLHEYGSNDDIKITFPVWILGSPGPINGPEGMIAGYLTAEFEKENTV